MPDCYLTDYKVTVTENSMIFATT